MKNQAPVAAKKPITSSIHGHERTDDYFWMREKENPETIAYLEAENEYVKNALVHTDEFQKDLFEEMKGRIQEADQSVPTKMGGFFYYVRMETGKEHPIHCRKKGSMEAEEEIVLDVNLLAEGFEYYSVSGLKLSPDHKLLAYAADNVGRRIYTVHFKNLETGETLPDVLTEVTGNMAWANDNQTVFFSKQDPQTLRSDKVFRHRLGEPVENAKLVYYEADNTFHTFVGKTKSKKYLILGCGSRMTDETRFLDADNPEGEFTVFMPRERGHEYQVEHHDDHFYVSTNDGGASNFKLIKTPINKTGRENWVEVIPHRKEVLLEDIDIFTRHLVVEERADGLIKLRIIRWDGGGEHYIDFGEPTYHAMLGANPDFDTDTIRYGYHSLTTPYSTVEYGLETREKVLLKQQPVLGGFDSENYISERLHATAPDGTLIPISLVRRKDVLPDGTHPLFLSGYGAYGISEDAYFSSVRLSLLDRGLMFALAHIRGGQDLGKSWYEDGRLLNKKNTFTDFIACSEHLIAKGYSSPNGLVISGGSAGGLLMGAVINMRPELFKAVLAAVPFVDVINTMLDDSIPLTTGEYDEWGNPNEKEYYDYILSYSPYDNVKRQDYPNLLITSGLHDSQVQYWEPTKWVAKLRDLKTDNNRLFLKTDMSAGHGGKAGRFERLKEVALEYAFVLDVLGIKK